MTANFDETILDTYPQHLAGAYARFVDQRDVAAQHTLLLALFEVALKHLAAAAVAQYALAGGADPAVADTLGRLAHPSLGHWTALLRNVLAWRRVQALADAEFVFPELPALYNKPAAELTAGAELVRGISKSGAGKVSLRQLFDAIVEYRNDQAHGAGQAGAQYAAMVPLLQSAFEELLRALPSLAERAATFVESIAVERGGAHSATLLRLISDRPRLRPVQEKLDPALPDPEPQQLYLLKNGALPGALSLHPLLIFLPACQVCSEAQVGVLNGTAPRGAEYLCYGCGHANTLKELRAEVSAFIAATAAPAAASVTPARSAAPVAAPPPIVTANNLPPERTEFVGRTREIAAVIALLRRPTVRLVTLTGPGGTGKTRLSLQIAARLLPDFADGVWLVDLSAITAAALVAPTLAAVLGLGEVPGQPLLETLKQALADKQMLFVLDNFEQVMAAAATVSAILKTAARVQFLVTSRSPLQIYGESEFELEPLDLPLALPPLNPLPPLEQLEQYGAIKLFVERAQAVRADFSLSEDNALAVASICVRLDGLPLAIELAAARIRLFPPPALLARLDQSLKVLTGGARDLPARQQTIRGAIEWSYDLLDAGERMLFWRLGVFRGGAALEALEAVCNADGKLPLDLLDGVEGLVSKSLLRQREGYEGEPRFTTLETIGEYAREKLRDSGEGDQLARQHAAYFLAAAEAAAPNLTGTAQAAWLARLAQDQANMRAVLAFTLAPGNGSATALRLATALYRFWGVRGHLTEGRNWFSQALAASAADSDATPLLRAKALDASGGLARIQGDFPAALALGDASLALFREAADDAGTAAALRNLTALAIEQGDLHRARQLGDEALALYRQIGDKTGMTTVLHDMGMAAHQEGDLVAAIDFYEQALDLKRQTGHKRGVAVSLNNLGMIREERGELPAASALFAESQALLDELGDHTSSAVVRTNLANLLEAQGQYAEARDQHRLCLSLFAQQGNSQRIAESLEGLAGPAAGLKQPDRAARLFGAAEALRESIGAPLPGWERARYDRYLAAARSQLAELAWQAAWQRGRAMDAKQAVTYALSDD